MIRICLGIVLFLIFAPEHGSSIITAIYNGTGISNETLACLTGDKITEYLSSNSTYYDSIGAMYTLYDAGCVMFVTLEHNNTEDYVYTTFDDTPYLNNSHLTRYNASGCYGRWRKQMSPRQNTFLIEAFIPKNGPPQNITVGITYEFYKVNPRANETYTLSPKSGQLYAMDNIKNNGSLKYIANGGYMTAFFACTAEWTARDDYNITFNDHCDRVMFFQNQSFLGALGDLRDAGSSVLSRNFPDLTIFQSFVPGLAAQVYFYVPSNPNVTFNQYAVSRNAKETITMPSNGANYAVKVHFIEIIVALNNYGRKLYSVNLTSNAVLYVYEGIAEIDGKNFPSDKLVVTIKQSGLFDDIDLSYPVYTFVASNGNVTYELTYARTIDLITTFIFIIIGAFIKY